MVDLGGTRAPLGSETKVFDLVSRGTQLAHLDFLVEHLRGTSTSLGFQGDLVCIPVNSSPPRRIERERERGVATSWSRRWRITVEGHNLR